MTNLNFQATSKLEEAVTSLLEHLAALDGRSLSSDAAHALLKLDVLAPYVGDFNALSEKAANGSLLPEEAAVLDKCIEAGDLLAGLQSRARQVLKNAGPAN